MWFAVFMVCTAMVYGNGSTEADLNALTEADMVNTQQLDMKSVSSVRIAYVSGSVMLFRGDSDSLVIKEYMSIDNSEYYARTSYATAANAAKQLVIEQGKLPASGKLHSYVEVYIPASFTGAMEVNTASGNIRSDDPFSFSELSLNTASGSTAVNDLNSNTAVLISTASGNISAQNIAVEKIQVSTASGSITVNGIKSNTTALISTASGSIMAQNIAADEIQISTASGSIRCTVAESTGDIILGTASGDITLGVSKNLGFHFSATVKDARGRLSTPFSDQLYTPVPGSRSATGTIGAEGLAEHELISIDITTHSGSIQVGWI
jgi:DUF4097 and DUF4098 domain-containing protein YvlB